LLDYSYMKSDMEDRPAPDYTPYIIKHIMYAKQHYPRPKYSDEAKAMLNEYYAEIGQTFGSPRIRETIYRIAQNIAGLKLKQVVDTVDTEETIKYFNVILLQLDKIISQPSSPRDTAYQECFKILNPNSP
jgi:DNA replicative helicase MCM subunit Mcm2 (Cdc46/Mcm family)